MITRDSSFYIFLLFSISLFSIIMAQENKNHDKAFFAAGCFWGVESTFQDLNGVVSTTVGYSGGKVKNPSYELVCTGITGHAEAVEVVYDSKIVSYKQLLDSFFTLHDPTTLNRQGPDVGTQYRSAIFYNNAEEKKLAEETITEINESGKFPNKIVTEVESASNFYSAEEYHQDYYKKRGLTGCAI